MHSKGVIGVQFLHSASNDFTVSVKLLLFSVFDIGDRTVIIVYFSFAACAVDREGLGAHPFLPEKPLVYFN
jgi:hypothetical protein